MLYDILLIFVCLFASLGIVEIAVCVFDKICAKRLPHGFYILADNFTKDSAEYIIRYLEGLILHSGLDHSVKGIRLGENAEIDDELLLRLQEEYRNIIR